MTEKTVTREFVATIRVPLTDNHFANAALIGRVDAAMKEARATLGDESGFVFASAITTKRGPLSTPRKPATRKERPANGAAAQA